MGLHELGLTTVPEEVNDAAAELQGPDVAVEQEAVEATVVEVDRGGMVLEKAVHQDSPTGKGHRTGWVFSSFSGCSGDFKGRQPLAWQSHFLG